MQSLSVDSFADLVQHGPCVVKNLLNGEVVREITPDGDDCRVKAGEVEIVVPLTTPIAYEPWHFDRGSLTFVHASMGQLKICTELDILEVTAGGEQFSIQPKGN